MYFKDFMDHIANNHGLIKEIDGSVASMNIMLPLGSQVHVVYDVLDSNKRGYVRMGTFIPPITKEGRARFMNFLLEFNRNATSYLDMGLAPHPANDNMFSVTWFASRKDLSLQDWNAAMDLYERLGGVAMENLRELMTEWARSLH